MTIRSESRKKTELIQVRATPLEKAELKERAEDFGVSVGELCRRAIFASIPRTRTDQKAIEELAATRADLGRLGGLFKGWLAGSFTQLPPSLKTRDDVVKLHQEIEAAQKEIVEAVRRLTGKAHKS